MALLLAHGAEPGLRNVRGESPLDLAAQYGRLDSVALLAGAQAHALSRLATPQHSPLHLAARNGHRQVVRLLLDRYDVFGERLGGWQSAGGVHHENTKERCTN